MPNSNHHARSKGLLLAAGAAVSLAGCDTGNMSRTFGLTRDAPDEFSVTTQAPLSMPDFNLSPRPGRSAAAATERRPRKP